MNKNLTGKLRLNIFLDYFEETLTNTNFMTKFNFSDESQVIVVLNFKSFKKFRFIFNVKKSIDFQFKNVDSFKSYILTAKVEEDFVKLFNAKFIFSGIKCEVNDE